MPNITVPGSLTYAGGALRSTRLVPAQLRFVAGNVATSQGTGTGTVTTPALNRLNRIIDKGQNESERDFQRRALIWQQSMEAIEAAFKGLTGRVDEIAAILARLTAAEQLAQTTRDEVMAVQAQVAVVQGAVAETFTQIDPLYGDEFENRVQP